MLLPEKMTKAVAIKVLYNGAAEKIPSIETIFVNNSPPNKNLGFAKAANIGIKEAIEKKADRILLINPDIKIKKGDIEKLTNSDFDITSPVLKFRRDNNWIYDFGGRINWLIGRTTHMEFFKERPCTLARVSPCEVDYVSGACMMIDRKVFEKIGFFDEQFFMYFEDVDFCLRAVRTGFKVGVCPNIIVEHKLEIHKQSGNWQKMQFLLKSNLLFIWKWIPWPEKILGFVYWTILAIKCISVVGLSTK